MNVLYQIYETNGWFILDRYGDWLFIVNKQGYRSYVNLDNKLECYLISKSIFIDIINNCDTQTILESIYDTYEVNWEAYEQNNKSII